jgi:hypothetical protein
MFEGHRTYEVVQLQSDAVVVTGAGIARQEPVRIVNKNAMALKCTCDYILLLLRLQIIAEQYHYLGTLRSYRQNTTSSNQAPI